MCLCYFLQTAAINHCKLMEFNKTVTKMNFKKEHSGKPINCQFELKRLLLYNKACQSYYMLHVLTWAWET